MDIADRIALGTQFLDAVKPGWAGEIDLEILDLSDPDSCILGQTFEHEADVHGAIGGYTVGGWQAHDWLVEQGYEMDNEHVEMNPQEMCGFEREGIYSGETGTDTYEMLEDAWVQVILTRV